MIYNKLKYKCTKCNKIMNSKNEWINHFRKNHSIIVKTYTERQHGALWCFTCGKWSKKCNMNDHNTFFRVFI